MTNRQLANPVIMSYEAGAATVLGSRELVRSNSDAPAQQSTRHLEISLPDGVTYAAGDHLGVVPRNDIQLIRRVMARFELDAGQYLTITTHGGTHTHLPIDEPTPLLGVLGSCVELQDVASRTDIETLVQYTDDPGQKAELEALLGDDEASRSRYRKRILLPNRSVLDLLDEYPACALPFESYLDMLPPLRPRYYSISSSPLVTPHVCSVTAGVLRAPARSGEGTFTGVCSSYLAGLPEKGTVFVFVRRPTIPFRPTENPHTPMIMVGAGTGLAPFRGFLQERDALKRQGVPVGPSLLFFGCREPECDDLYADELREFEDNGVVRVHTVFSRRPEEGRKYVQHQMASRNDEVWNLIQNGAAIFVCGNANTMAPGVRAALSDIYRERTGRSAQEAQDWIANLRADGRFVEDIWGG
jgi:cytochrome P450/NADPH-cytochrome P450 reductase